MKSTNIWFYFLKFIRRYQSAIHLIGVDYFCTPVYLYTSDRGLVYRFPIKNVKYNCQYFSGFKKGMTMEGST